MPPLSLSHLTFPSHMQKLWPVRFFHEASFHSSLGTIIKYPFFLTYSQSRVQNAPINVMCY